jgi:hypothetical protein
MADQKFLTESDGWHIVKAEDFAVVWRYYDNKPNFEAYSIDFVTYRLSGDYFLDDAQDASYDNLQLQPVEGGHEWEGNLKWDHCCNFGKREGSFFAHYCGFGDAQMLGRIMAILYTIGPCMQHWDR